MTTETTISLVISVFNSLCIVGLGIYTLKENGKQNKKIQAFNFAIKDYGDLQRKIHDRMENIARLIKIGNRIDDTTEDRTRKTASRLNTYDDKDTIRKDVEKLLNGWESSMTLFGQGIYDEGRLSKEKSIYIDLTKKILDRVDEIYNSLRK
jgi:hypothetical protein